MVEDFSEELNNEFKAAPQETKVKLTEFLSEDRLRELDEVNEKDPSKLRETMEKLVSEQSDENNRRLNNLV